MTTFLNPHDACEYLKCPEVWTWFDEYLDDNDTGKLYDRCEKWILENYHEVTFSEYTCEVKINLDSKVKN
jgi:hypothetical protein